ncbi:MAG: hypothetical protein R2867_33500 [Caldilineaceae bacterium]
MTPTLRSAAVVPISTIGISVMSDETKIGSGRTLPTQYRRLQPPTANQPVGVISSLPTLSPPGSQRGQR